MSKYDLNDLECKIFYKSDSEFEEVRKQCLLEDNWLKNNYSIENLKIEEHSGYGVIFKRSTGQPMVMGGVFNDGRYPSNVARHLNRLYTFPDFRMKATEMVDAFRVACVLVDELKKVNSYEVYISTMQNRPKRKKHGFWRVWVKNMQLASNNAWQTSDNYIQACPWDVQKCWQHFVWQENKPGAFADWNPKLISHDVWQTLPEGK